MEQAKKSPLAIVCIGLTVAFTVVGEIAMKKGLLQIGSSPSHPGQFPQFLGHSFTNALVLAGIFCAIASAVTWILAIARVPLSFAYPFQGLGIVLVLTLARAILHEPVSPLRWVGVLAVAGGLWLATSR